MNETFEIPDNGMTVTIGDQRRGTIARTVGREGEIDTLLFQGPGIYDIIDGLAAEPYVDDEHFLYELSTPPKGAEVRKYLQEIGGYNKAHGKFRVLRRIASTALGEAKQAYHHVKGDEIDDEQKVEENDFIELKQDGDPAGFGLIELHGEKMVMFFTDYEHNVGAVGVETGAKYAAAVEYALKHDLSLLVVPESAGMNVKDGGVAVHQMRVMTELNRLYKEKSKRPLIMALTGKTLGGMAPIVPQADFVVAIKGAVNGFAGDKVRDAYSNDEIDQDKALQSIEANLVHRNIDVVASSKEELAEYIANIVRVTRKKKRHEKLESPIDKDAFRDKPLREFESYGDGIIPLFQKNRSPKVRAKAKPAEHDLSTPYGMYENARISANRVDTEFVLQYGFDNYTPLWTSYERDGKIISPHIIAGIGESMLSDGSIKSIMVIGNNPDYHIYEDGSFVRKFISSPGPEDARYILKQLGTAKRFGWSVLFLCDTPGANPSIQNEWDGLNEEFGKVYTAEADFENETVAIVTGIMGSGGGLLSDPVANANGMTSDATLHTAEPQADAAIVLGKDEQLTQQHVIDTANKGESTAVHMQEIGLSDFTVETGEGPYETADNIVMMALPAFDVKDEKNKNVRRGRAMKRHRSARALKQLAIYSEEIAA